MEVVLENLNSVARRGEARLMFAFRHATFVLVLLLVATAASAADSEVRVETRDALMRALAGARPGTTIRIAPGVYRGGIVAGNVRGTPERPIIITAEHVDDPPVFEGGGSGMQLSKPAYVELRHLVFRSARGNGLNIDDGGSRQSLAHHVTLVGLRVEDVGPRGNRDGVKLSGINEFLVQDCTVLRWGDGGSAMDLVGCHDGRIEDCDFEHADAPQANGVQTKGGSHNVVIRRCRFKNAGGRALNVGGSTGLPYFRPADAQYEGAGITIEDCTIVGSLAAAAFVGVDGANFQYNTIYQPTRWILRILQENTDPRFVACRNVRCRRNLIVFEAEAISTTINVGPDTRPETFAFSENAWYCSDRPAQTRSLIRLPADETDGVYGQAPQFVAPADGEFRQETSSPLRDYGVRPANAQR